MTNHLKRKFKEYTAKAMGRLFILLFFSSLLTACGEQTSMAKNNLKTYEVKPENIHKTLYFTGTMQPLKENTLTSPMDAVVETMHYHYGQRIKKNDVVFTLNSPELQKQYNEVLTDYLKAKDTYTIAQAKFVGTEDLWQAGLLSKNNYLSEKSSLNNARVSLMQATHKLSDMLEKMDNDGGQNLSSLSFAAFDKVRLALTAKHNMIHLKSPDDGVLLYPPKSNEDKSGRLTVGTAVKAGQVLALIGDMSGICVEIDIPEVDIDKVKPGMPAVIRSTAFPKEALQGKLIVMNAQASTTSAATLPSFTAIVEVKGLTLQQQAWVKVGMSASIELSVDSADKLMIPIAAVKLKAGKSIVQVLEKNGTHRIQEVTTGSALVDKVVIDSGLKSGDVVIYD
ncbi:efflux RND transporter periplasmic adaptor subunit [Legionella oakridgensis]|uniref:efflux RND transporter periplasmic adaptor subunit n=1 Tax=Legionella oakridgensis TaxID=29423 RepID=UPI0003DE724C|nr:efflux RND transporter periplasmic adaptor subunit [Legionella oakridgensis]ETO92165.1 membrane-fusion protein [Legionella oakridgensis RV-2-2007]